MTWENKGHTSQSESRGDGRRRNRVGAGSNRAGKGWSGLEAPLEEADMEPLSAAEEDL